ncbi:zf-HC2 domain-containing protein, partial [bacterium]
MCLDYIKLNEYFDKALEIQEKNLVEEHLMSCSKCRLALNNLIVINKTISILPKPVVGSYFVDKILAKISKVDHPSIEELNDYCDNNISGFAYNKISEHIEECDKCRDSINSIKIQATPYFEQFEFKASANFLDNIFAKIDMAESESISETTTFEIKPVISN